MKNWTGERLETFVYNKNTIDHLHRYSIATNYILDKVVLDIACGEGYGSNLMSKSAKFVYGVDIDSETIANAKIKYVKSNLNFQTGSADNIPIPDASIDVVVSYETIEHHDKHDEMMLEIKRVLKSDGVLIISTPDKLFYTDKRNYINEFHVKELYKNEFFDLVVSKFANIQILNQLFVNGNSIIYPDSDDNLNVYKGDYFNIGSYEVNPLYLIIIASDIFTTPQWVSVFDGSKVFSMDDDKIEKIYKSKSYIIGNFILKPFKVLKKIFR
jgi:ubiquinone/menaquinone biosynthesis C-methylase UbiE